MTQIGRNALCPCGSGKKYKRCCGEQASPVLVASNESPAEAPPMMDRRAMERGLADVDPNVDGGRCCLTHVLLHARGMPALARPCRYELAHRQSWQLFGLKFVFIGERFPALDRPKFRANLQNHAAL